jgi:hypothetical protein
MLPNSPPPPLRLTGIRFLTIHLSAIVGHTYRAHGFRFPRLPDSGLLRVPDSRLLRYSYILKRIDNSNTRALFGHYFHTFHNKSAKHRKLDRALSLKLFHRSVPFPNRRFANLLHEFRQSDVSRVTKFFQVPQH